MTLTFTIPGPPVPWQRDATFQGRRITAKRTRAFEKHVRACAAVAMLKARLRPWNGPCRLSLDLYVADKRRRDNSNMLKAIEDGSNGVVWTDDSWILRLGNIDRFLDKANPRTEVKVEFLNEWDAWKAEP